VKFQLCFRDVSRMWLRSTVHNKGLLSDKWSLRTNS